MKDESLALAYVHPGHVDAHFMQSIVNVLVDDSHRQNPRVLRGGSYIAIGSGPRIAEARNQCVLSFLNECQAAWLLMIDTDMVFPVSALDKIMEAADPETAPIIGGLCFGGGRSGVMFPTMYRLVKPELNESPVQTIEEYPPDAMCEVDATGAAFLLIHRSVLQKMGETYKDSPYPWFLEGSVYKGTKFGEDWAFCMRAKTEGFPIHVHTGVKIGHVKPQVLDEDGWLAFKAKKNEIGEAGVQQNFKRKIMGGEKEPDAPTYVVIPQKGKIDMTRRLVKQLHDQGNVAGIFIFDNGSTQTELAATYKFAKDCDAQVIEAEGKTIHQMWNEGHRLAGMGLHDAFNLAVLNNDLRIGPYFLLRQATALRSDDLLSAVCPNYDKRKGSGVQYVNGTKGMNGMSGFAFMFKGERFDTPFDEGFAWWYGDDDFAMTVREKGNKVGFVYGVSVEHIDGGSQTAKDHPFEESIRHDRARFAEKWHFVEDDNGYLVQQLAEVS